MQPTVKASAAKEAIVLPDLLKSEEEDNYDFDEFDDDDDVDSDREGNKIKPQKRQKQQKENSEFQKVSRHYESKFNKKLD